MLSGGILLSGLLGLAAAQFPPKLEGVTVLKSRFHENVTISYKEVRSFHCPTRSIEPVTLTVARLTIAWTL
jgi:hypothetical protein